MSENCGNPNCPHHGETEIAVKLRTAMQDIKTNEQLMSAMRIIGGNANDAMAQEMRSLEGLAFSAQILKGEADQDPIMVGMVRGLSVLLAHDFAPAKVFLEECRKIEGPVVVDLLVEKAREEAPAPDFFTVLQAFLNARGRR